MTASEGAAVETSINYALMYIDVTSEYVDYVVA